ncbi:MAG: translation initiation factor 2 [Lachnospiraceae bacterium]|nr:translation initiation factor 2 [Lachnospiraceae bacterium]MBR3429256.1 translation initiation factor 2 [Clostridia bacterium]
MTYDVVCPICGRINRSLYLEETEGWMECEYCGNSTQDLSFRKMVRVPVIRMDQLKQAGMQLAAANA